MNLQEKERGFNEQFVLRHAFWESYVLQGGWQDCSKVSSPSIFTQTKDLFTNGNSVTWSHKQKMTLGFLPDNKCPRFSVSNPELLLCTQNVKVIFLSIQQLLTEFLLSLGP